MPHIIVEYSKQLDDQMPQLLKAMHESLANSGIDMERIKTRGISVDHNVVGETGLRGLMMHATLLILEGRDLATKKSYGDPLHNLMKRTAPAGCAVTLEIRDMNKDTYYL
jgi:5-carboxymethyl-2-hydroxymuconate isomerase